MICVIVKSPAFCLLFAMVFCSACTKPPPELKVKVGEPFPRLSVSDLKNNPVTLDFASGKITVLNLWATWCGPCRHEMPSLDRLDKMLDETKFRVIGVSVDHDSHLVREFLIERKIYFENYLDKNMVNANNYIGVRVFPSTFFISSDGNLLKVIEGWRYWDTLESMNKIKALAGTFKP